MVKCTERACCSLPSLHKRIIIYPRIQLFFCLAFRHNIWSKEHIGLNCQVNCVSGWYLLFSAPCTMRACFSSSRSGLSLATTMPNSWSCIPSGVIMKFSRVTWTEQRKTQTVLGAGVLRILFLMRADPCVYYLQEPQKALFQTHRFPLWIWHNQPQN